MRDTSFTDTTLGMLKAHHMLTAQKNRRMGPPAKPKFSYEAIGTVVHASRCLKSDERAHMESVLKELRSLDGLDPSDTDRIKALMAELRSLPIKFVPIKHEKPVSHSKSYPTGDVIFA